MNFFNELFNKILDICWPYIIKHPYILTLFIILIVLISCIYKRDKIRKFCSYFFPTFENSFKISSSPNSLSIFWQPPSYPPIIINELQKQIQYEWNFGLKNISNQIVDKVSISAKIEIDFVALLNSIKNSSILNGINHQWENDSLILTYQDNTNSEVSFPFEFITDYREDKVLVEASEEIKFRLPQGIINILIFNGLISRMELEVILPKNIQEAQEHINKRTKPLPKLNIQVKCTLSNGRKIKQDFEIWGRVMMIGNQLVIDFFKDHKTKIVQMVSKSFDN